MFSRMLKLPEEVRAKYDLSSLEVAMHAAAPCPVQVKEQMIEWWGPIILEYYGATEGLGFTACDSDEWLAHRGTVGKAVLGDLHVLDDDMQPVPDRRARHAVVQAGNRVRLLQRPGKTAEARSPDGTMSTVGDVGYVDDDGFLYLTDRSTFMIISGGVNIYPQECENLLITHPKVADAAVFGVPNEDLGEEVKAVVQPMPEVAPGPELADELLAFCAEHLSRQKSLAQSISRPSCRGSRPASSTSASCATGIGPTTRAGSRTNSRRPRPPVPGQSLQGGRCHRARRVHGLGLVVQQGVQPFVAEAAVDAIATNASSTTWAAKLLTDLPAAAPEPRCRVDCLLACGSNPARPPRWELTTPAATIPGSLAATTVCSRRRLRTARVIARANIGTIHTR